MSSEYQELLEKLLNSDTTDVIPQSRAEYIMLTAINSLGIDTLPEPDSRIEAYLMALITKLENNGSSGGLTASQIDLLEDAFEHIQWADDVGPQYAAKLITSLRGGEQPELLAEIETYCPVAGKYAYGPLE